MRYAIGVDGGGTYTRAVVVDADGRELGRADGAAAVADAWNPAPPAEAVAAVCAAAAAAGGIRLPVDAVWAALTGAGRERAQTAVREGIEALGVARQVRVGPDAGAAFHDAFGDGPGILLIAGTGSVAWGRGSDGREARAGGWGLHVGDEGSAWAMGSEALHGFGRQWDGRDARTALCQAVLDALGLGGVDEVVHWAGGATKGEVAALAKVVVACAAGGDPAAEGIVARTVADLADHVRALRDRLEPWPEVPTVALVGGLIGPAGPLRERITAALATLGVGCLERPLDPARGAALLALTLDG